MHLWQFCIPLTSHIKTAVCIVYAVCTFACLLSKIGVKVDRVLLTSIQYWTFQSSLANALPSQSTTSNELHMYTHMVCCSLVPRPSYHPLFGCLQYAKDGGGRPGLFHYVSDISVYLDRQKGGGIPD